MRKVVIVCLKWQTGSGIRKELANIIKIIKVFKKKNEPIEFMNYYFQLTSLYLPPYLLVEFIWALMTKSVTTTRCEQWFIYFTRCWTVKCSSLGFKSYRDRLDRPWLNPQIYATTFSTPCQLHHCLRGHTNKILFFTSSCKTEWTVISDNGQICVHRN